MDLLQSATQFSNIRMISPFLASPTHPRRRIFTMRCCLPFPKHQAKYHKELEAAIDAVERACRLCVDVKKSLFASEGRIVEKNDQTPVTVADFGVQALISLELMKQFPSIPLVAEEDSVFLRNSSSNNLVDSIVSTVNDKASIEDKQLTEADVLGAIDRGGKDAFTFCTKPASYWVLDPIDGTKGFLKGDNALYVVGLSLVMDGEIVLGIMGCPNWNGDTSERSSRRGIMMVAHAGCGTWTKSLEDLSGNIPRGWTRRSVDMCSTAQNARICISDGQTWESLPLSSVLVGKTEAKDLQDNEVLLMKTCCGSLLKYMLVASGRASVFVLRTRAEKILKSWDHSVGIICVQEAGGKVTDWEGIEIDLEADQTERRGIFPAGGILVSNSELHGTILDIISSHSVVV